jgi:putative membrane protein insertion efficiency factor
VIRRVALRFIATYQATVRERLATSCPFEPTCSEYGRLAFEHHGPVRATRMTVARIRRCRPGVTGPRVDWP